MDDFIISNLHESRNEWCSRLISIFCPLIIEGVRSIFEESWKMCIDGDQLDKYLMTFQTLLVRVPKWNTETIEIERKRIVEKSECNYLEDLISCVHIIQLKVLTCIRVGNRQKQIDISIPKLDNFIHKIYIHVARKLYSNVYLYDKKISSLQNQKYGRQIEFIVQECILTTIRESIPTEDIIRAYMNESVEHEEEVTIEPIIEKNIIPTPLIDEKINENIIPVTEVGIKDIEAENITTHLTFNDFDSTMDEMNQIDTINAPKTIERLEAISTSNALQRKIDESDEEEKENRIKIHDDIVDLGTIDNLEDDKDVLLLDVQELPRII